MMGTRLSFILRIIVGVALGIVALAAAGTAQTQTAGEAIANTMGDFEKPNQNKVFFHDGTWWVAARALDENWYLWKYNDDSWEQDLLIDTANKSRPDCYVDSTRNRLYIAHSHTSESKFVRASYNGSGWVIDTGFPVEIDYFTHSDDDVISLGVDRSGWIWLFRIHNGVLETVYSNDDGATWSRIVVVKAGLNDESGITDAVPFKIGDVDYIGVAYGEDEDDTTVFGFLHRKIGDPVTVWTDETSMMEQFPGTNADNHISAMADPDGNIYIITKTSGGQGVATKNGLYKRDANGWNQYIVTTGDGWSRPALTIDAQNRQLYVFGTFESIPQTGVYKRVGLGEENLLLYIKEVIVFENGNERFRNFSLAAHHVDNTTDLMVVIENNTENNIWFNQLEIETPTGVREGENDDTAPDEFRLLEPFPNPVARNVLAAGKTVSIRIELSADSEASLKIYNILGQLVTVLAEERPLAAGNFTYIWDGRDLAGRYVPAGVYFLRARAGQRSAMRKLLILR